MDILLLDELAPDARDWLAARHAVHYRPELVDDAGALAQALMTVDALIVPPRVKINRAFLELAPRVCVIGRIHDGTENVDYEACQRRRVRIVQASGAMVRANAEFLLTSLLLLYRTGACHLPTGADRGRFETGREINDSVIGLLGLAPAAHLLATMLVALGARVVGYDPAVHRSADLWRRLGVQPMGLDEMLGAADAVSVQTVYASRYRGLISDRVLINCKWGQKWVSISRPSLYDFAALRAALDSGRISSFVMDSDDPRVFEAGSPLRDAPHLHVVPRLAPHTQESLLRGSWYLVDRVHESLIASDSRRMTLESQPLPLRTL